MKHIRTRKGKQRINKLSLILLCSEMFIIFVICICISNMSSDDEEYKNRRAKVGYFFKPIQLYQSEEGQLSAGEVSTSDREAERIGLTIGRLREQYSCYNRFGILVKNVFIECRDTKLLIKEVEESYKDYYFELEVDEKVDNVLLNNLLDSLKHYSKKRIELIVSNSENKRIVKTLPDHFEF
ncbi:MAG: hypothetical protein R2828_25630 [Saprospiraceae bacterium]